MDVLPEIVRLAEAGRVVRLSYRRPGDGSAAPAEYLVEPVLDEPGVETALALSGSAAQSKIQSYPGDCDYFERVNIQAPTRTDACKVLSRVMREKVLATEKGPTYQFIEAKYGSFPYDCERRGKAKAKGKSKSKKK